MNKNRTSVFQNGLIWFGAGVSIAEIITGTYFAPLGFGKGMLAILLGHLIGGLLFVGAGLIGGFTRKSSMETVKMSFGQKGSILFALLNIIQLVGWTAIMIYDGALAADGLWDIGHILWCSVIGILILVWIGIGINNLGKLNTVAMSALFVLTLILSVKIFGGVSAPFISQEALTFGGAVELSVAMPLSWLPLISDYTREAEKPVKATIVSGIVYTIISCWMYGIGMGAAIFTGEYNIAQIILKSGLGLAGMCIVILSTVTTTFLDAYSAGVSSESIFPNVNGKWIAIGTTIIGTIGAIAFPMDNITNFLYFIGSVFAPMIGVLLVDYFLLKEDNSRKMWDIMNLCIWFLGFILYRWMLKVDTPLGSTVPSIVLTMLLCIAIHKLWGKKKIEE